MIFFLICAWAGAKEVCNQSTKAGGFMDKPAFDGGHEAEHELARRAVADWQIENKIWNRIYDEACVGAFQPTTSAHSG